MEAEIRGVRQGHAAQLNQLHDEVAELSSALAEAQSAKAVEAAAAEQAAVLRNRQLEVDLARARGTLRIYLDRRLREVEAAIERSEIAEGQLASVPEQLARAETRGNATVM